MDKVKSVINLTLGTIAWLSLIGLVWGLLLGWFHEEVNWIQLLIAGVIFFLIGLIATVEPKKKDDGSK